MDHERAQTVRCLLDASASLLAAIESGRVGFDGALQAYVKGTDNELSRALGAVLEEIKAGAARHVALTQMAERMDVPEVTAFIGALVQSDAQKISLAQTLRDQVAQLRQTVDSSAG